jgi:hypothetical protein
MNPINAYTTNTPNTHSASTSKDALRTATTTPDRSQPATPPAELLEALAPNTSPAARVSVSAEALSQANAATPNAHLERKALVEPAPYDAEKVAQFQQLVQHPEALAEYLSALDPEALSHSVLQGPASAFLRRPRPEDEPSPSSPPNSPAQEA